MIFREMLQDEREEGRKEGRNEGIVEDRIQLIRRKMERGKSPEDISKELETDIVFIRKAVSLIKESTNASNQELAEILLPEAPDQ